MNKEQFISLLRSPATINLNLVKELEEITQQFPYFQNAHMLLAKQYQGHENIRYESYLRKAAAYAPDRSVLYHLIKLEPSEVIHMQKEHSAQPEKEKKIVSTAITDDVKEKSKVEAPVQQPKIITKEVSQQKETPKENIKEPQIPEIITAVDAPAKTKNTEEAHVPVMSSVTETPEISKKTIETKASEIDTPVEVNIPEKKTEEPLIPEINTITESPVVSKKIKEPKSPEPDVQVIAEKKTEEVSVTEINTTTEAPVISNKTKEPKVAEIDSSVDVNFMAENANETEAFEVKETKIETEVPPDSQTPSRKTKTESDPQEILAKRLEEIANPKTVTKEVSPAPIEKTQPESVPPTIPVEQKPKEIIAKPSEPLVSKPILPKEEVKPVSEHHSFLEWLRIKDIPVLAADRHHDYFKENLKSGESLEDTSSDPENNIIDNFIKTEPRIVPAKSEFYSPGNMARQSAMEHEDLISETLARIYAQQGNIPKAIDAYRRLSLKLPEKSSYFAALIKELEERDRE